MLKRMDGDPALRNGNEGFGCKETSGTAEFAEDKKMEKYVRRCQGLSRSESHHVGGGTLYTTTPHHY